MVNPKFDGEYFYCVGNIMDIWFAKGEIMFNKLKKLVVSEQEGIKQWIYFVIIGIALFVAIIMFMCSCSLYKNDNPVEQKVEGIIKDVTGEIIDLSPEVKEVVS